MSNEAYDNFVALITHEDRIQSVLNYLIMSTMHYVEDPIAYVCMKFLKEKISIMFAHQGVSIFKSDSSIIIPFNKMKHKEIHALKSLLQMSSKNNIIFLNEQRGGSNSITIAQEKQQLRIVRPSIILRAVRELLKPLNEKFKVDVVNVVLQRLICSAKISSLEIEASQDNN